MTKKKTDDGVSDADFELVLDHLGPSTSEKSKMRDAAKKRQPNRTIVLVDEIEDPLVRLTAEQLARLRAESDEPVTVQIQSRGGSINGGWAMHDLLATADLKVMTEGYGIVGSGAALAFLGGRYRLLAPNARFLVHEMRFTVGEGVIKLSEMRHQLKNMESMQRKIDRLLAKETGLSLAEVRGWNEKDTYFTAQQAVKMGLADGLLRLNRRPRQG